MGELFFSGKDSTIVARHGVVPMGRAGRHFATGVFGLTPEALKMKGRALTRCLKEPAPPQKSRPVGHGLIGAGMRTDSMIGVISLP
jgi:hypothetical protein